MNYDGKYLCSGQGSESPDSSARHTIELSGFSWLKKDYPDDDIHSNNLNISLATSIGFYISQH